VRDVVVNDVNAGAPVCFTPSSITKYYRILLLISAMGDYFMERLCGAALTSDIRPGNKLNRFEKGSGARRLDAIRPQP